MPHKTDDMPASDPPQSMGKQLPTVEPMPIPIQTIVFVDICELLYTEAMKKETKIVIIFLAVVLLFLIFQLWRQYTFIQRAQTIQAIRGHISQELTQLAALRHRGPLTVVDISYIQAWMTFDYINTAFNIPPSYLSNYVHSSQYPHISILHYARETATSSVALTTDISGAVRSYLIASSTNELHP